MHIDLSSIDLPDIYVRQNRKCYLDPIRKKLIFITPEETVRQQAVGYLLHELKVPANMITVEAHLAHYGLDSKQRADIVIHALDENGIKYPIAIVECKAPGIYLGEAVGDQLANYCNELGADYAMMINDVDNFCYHYDSNIDDYVRIDSLPVYSEMLKGAFLEYEQGDMPERVKFEDISECLRENAEDFSGEISPQTNHELACASFNLFEGLLDPNHKIPAKQYNIFRLIEDYGVRQLTYGNAGGGAFYGLYRSFLIDYNGSTEFVSIGFASYSRTEKPDVSKTALMVAIDNEKDSHHALQLSIDDNVKKVGNSFVFYHSGRIAIGNKGSGKTSELQAFVKERYPQIIEGAKFNLGQLTYDRLWNLDDEEVIHLIENLISYSLIRDEYRNHVKTSN